MPKSIWLTDLAGGVLESQENSPLPAMTPCFPVRRRLSLPQGPFSPFGGRFGGQTRLFRPFSPRFAPKRAAPFRPGCSLRRAGWSMDGGRTSPRGAGCSPMAAGCSRRGAGCPIDAAGTSMRGAGCSIDGAGARPFSRREDPGAWREDPAPRGCETWEGSAETPLRIAKPADRSVRAPLDAPLGFAQPRTVNREPRTEPA